MPKIVLGQEIVSPEDLVTIQTSLGDMDKRISVLEEKAKNRDRLKVVGYVLIGLLVLNIGLIIF